MNDNGKVVFCEPDDPDSIGGVLSINNGGLATVFLGNNSYSDNMVQLTNGQEVPLQWLDHSLIPRHDYEYIPEDYGHGMEIGTISSNSPTYTVDYEVEPGVKLSDMLQMIRDLQQEVITLRKVVVLRDAVIQDLKEHRRIEL